MEIDPAEKKPLAKDALPLAASITFRELQKGLEELNYFAAHSK
jgi:hypothetical protein